MSLVRVKAMVIVSIVTAWSAGCRTVGSADDSTSKDIFTTSRRRPATTDEAAYVARIEACTGFFLQSTQGRTLLMTARHCFEHKLASARAFCTTPPYNTVTDSSGKTFTCKELLAGDETFHDVLVFEFKEKREGEALKLAIFSPEVGMRLKMLGFPGDELNTNRAVPWSSENCTVKVVDVESPFKNAGHNSNDVNFRHDCATYGGNSGGPMLIEGTDVAIGMPSRFTSKVINNDRTFNWRGDDFSFGIALWDFATAHRSRLSHAGVVFVGVLPASSGGQSLAPDYFFTGRFRGSVLSNSDNKCFDVTPRYRLRREVDSILVKPCGQNAARELSCKKEGEVSLCLLYDGSAEVWRLRSRDEIEAQLAGQEIKLRRD